MNILSLYLILQPRYFIFLSGLLYVISIFAAGDAFAQSTTSEAESSISQSNEPAKRRRRSRPTFAGRKVQKEAVVPNGDNEVITDIRVQYVDKDGNLVKGKTNPDVIKREFTLQSGDNYDSQVAKKGLTNVLDLEIINRASLILEPVEKDSAIMIVTVEEAGRLLVGFGLTLPPPTALQGLVRPITVNAINDSADGFGAGVRVGLSNIGGNNQKVTLGVEGGTEKFGLDLGYRKFFRHDRGIGVNFFTRRGIEPEFDDGDRDVNLKNQNDPWVHRLGGGIEYFRPIAKDFDGAIGLTYRKVSVRDAAFSDDIESEDELGNSLTVDEDGQDDLLTLNFAAVLDKRDDFQNPTRGYQLEFGSDQYFPIGEAEIVANRLAANYTQYLPLRLFGFGEGARTLVLNFQGGTILGDAIPYDAFILGGSSSVRGYDTSEISTSRSFVQASAEYRYPISSFDAFKYQFNLGGTVFIDYATDLGSADAVIGQPAKVRERPGDGFGYGLGLRTQTPIGTVRTEFALNDEGDTEFIFAVGDRF